MLYSILVFCPFVNLSYNKDTEIIFIAFNPGVFCFEFNKDMKEILEDTKNTRKTHISISVLKTGGDCPFC